MTCPWNNRGEEFTTRCPILWHSLYPYFLGFVFGARYSESGECKVCCPANIDTVVRMTPNDGQFPEYVPGYWRDVIHAEVVRVKGICDYGYEVGEVIFFPTFAKELFNCPAALYNAFPFREWGRPKCIDKNRLHCPDWKEEAYVSIKEDV